MLKLISMCHTATHICYYVVCSQNLADYIDSYREVRKLTNWALLTMVCLMRH